MITENNNEEQQAVATVAQLEGVTEVSEQKTTGQQLRVVALIEWEFREAYEGGTFLEGIRHIIEPALQSATDGLARFYKVHHQIMGGQDLRNETGLYCVMCEFLADACITPSKLPKGCSFRQWFRILVEDEVLQVFGSRHALDAVGAPLRCAKIKVFDYTKGMYPFPGESYYYEWYANEGESYSPRKLGPLTETHLLPRTLEQAVFWLNNLTHWTHESRVVERSHKLNE